MKQFKILCFYVFLLVSVTLLAQERPPIQTYSPNEYGAENQNWGISQSKDKYIYVANNKGLLEFNGARWKLYSLPNQTIVRSVKVIDDLIYTGCYRDFGYWKRNNFGVLTYVSLAKQLNISFLEDEEVWNIIPIDNFIVFQTLNRIYLYNKGAETYAIINSDTTINKVFKVNEGVYFQKAKYGVYEIHNGKPSLVSDDPILKTNLLVNIFNHNGDVLFETEDNGFYILKNNNLIRWEIPANNILLNDRIYSSTQLKDQSFVLGSISNGILLISADGKVTSQINQNNGLSNNTVLSVFQDVDSNIWLGLEYGINCINIKSPFKIYNDEKGKIGSVNASILYDNKLYIGTNQGLFYKKLEDNGGFKFIKGTQGATWCLREIDNNLFCGHNSGTFIINGDKAQLISDVLGTWDIKPIEKDSNLLLQGNYDGLYILEKKNGDWHFRNKLDGFDISSRYYEMLNKTEVFVSHEYKGVFRVKLNTDYTKVTSVTKDTSAHKGTTTSLIKYKGDYLYTQQDGVFKFSLAKNRFIKDSILSQLFNKQTYTSGRLINDIKGNKLWSFSSQEISYVTPSKLSNIPKINNISLPRSIRSDVSGFENISYLNDNKYLYGNSSGYIIIDLDKLHNESHSIKINSISNSNFKNGNGFKSNYLDRSVKGDLQNNQNNIEFHYSVPEFNKYLVTEYQYKLEGIYNQWSNWSSKPSEVFENLPYGDYTFLVRARVGNTLSSNTESYNFKIERPWLLSNQMIAVYIILFSLLSLVIHNMYKRYYKKQREKLLYKTQKELELKELENKQQLMRFNNDKLRQDIENKNRELGISTMSLIKKNEFLNNLKTELKKADDIKKIRRIVKIIDKNLNNTDDWNLFEEAFNNADKDFLKKVKSEHPTLTSNDLRLCAYLRLNLSSKEIAPLLNITPRSVEVKRYRLRKKMGLSHESSLIDYILNI
ncbi:triple tyrosine motif-containing protein [Tenacibaculum sp.]|uniref:helix-turn-helix and ligand-binding sensor domain-containing protein n=1 Tax=Tenacibaculum sp. TaxID=1906242 RepID=UPI003D0F0A1B